MDKGKPLVLSCAQNPWQGFHQAGLSQAFSVGIVASLRLRTRQKRPSRTIDSRHGRRRISFSSQIRRIEPEPEIRRLPGQEKPTFTTLELRVWMLRFTQRIDYFPYTRTSNESGIIF